MKTVKKILSSVLALILLIPALSLLAFAGEDMAEVEILSQPSAKNPTFLLENASVSSYEWYEVTYENTKITDEDEGIQSVGTYDSEDGVWIPSTQDLPAFMFFIFKPKAGERIYIEYDPSILASDFALYTEDGEYIYFDSVGRGAAEIVVPESKYCYLSCNPALFEPKVKAYRSEQNEPTLIDGQSTATLTEYEIGKYYFAKAILESGEKISSDLFYMDYAITSYPTAGDMSVKTSCDGDVSFYEWYYVGFGKEYTVSASPRLGDFTVYEGTFENGAWTGEYINIAVNGESGDVLFIEPLPGTVASASFFDSDEALDQDENGRFFCESTPETDLHVDFEVRISDGEGVKIYVQRDNQKLYVEEMKKPIYDEIKQEIHAQYTEYGFFDGEKWIGVDEGLVIYFTNERDNSVLKLENVVGDRILLYHENSEQFIEPSGDSSFPLLTGEYTLEIYRDGDTYPEAEIFVSDGQVEYKLTEMTKSVFDEEKSALYVDYINNGKFKDGLWYPNDDANEIDVEFDMKAGDILTVIASEDFDGDVVLDFSAGMDEISLEKIDGKYIFVADKYYDFDLELENCENDFSAQITIERSTLSRIEAERGKEIKPNKLGYYFASVTFENGATLTSKPVRFDNCDHKYNENKAPCDETPSLCSVCQGTVLAKGHSFGEWAETKPATRNDGGEEARMCKVCGNIEIRSTEKIGGLGVGVIFIIIGAGALLSLASIGISILIFKKKSLKP